MKMVKFKNPTRYQFSPEDVLATDYPASMYLEIIAGILRKNASWAVLYIAT